MGRKESNKQTKDERDDNIHQFGEIRLKDKWFLLNMYARIFFTKRKRDGVYTQELEVLSLSHLYSLKTKILTMSLRNDIMRFSVLEFRSDIRIELQAPVVYIRKGVYINQI